MRKLLVSLFLLAPLLPCPLTIADTPVSGIITGHEVWDLARSPYVLAGNVTIDPNGSLTIEHDVEVYIPAYYSYALGIYVRGQLIASGCYFSIGSSGHYRSTIKYEDNSSGFLQKTAISGGGAITIASSDVLVTDCNISSELIITDGSPTISSNTFDTQITLHADQSAQIHGNTFTSIVPYYLMPGASTSGISGNTYEYHSPMVYVGPDILEHSWTIAPLDGLSWFVLKGCITVQQGVKLTLVNHSRLGIPAYVPFFIEVWGEFEASDSQLELARDGSKRSYIGYKQGSTGSLSNCTVSGGGAITIAASDVLVTDCNISSELIITDGSPTISSNTFDTQITLHADQSAQIHGNTFTSIVPYYLMPGASTSGISGNTYEYHSPMVYVGPDILEHSWTIAPLDGLSWFVLKGCITVQQGVKLTLVNHSRLGIPAYVPFFIEVWGEFEASDSQLELARDGSKRSYIGYKQGSTGSLSNCTVTGGGAITIASSDVLVTDCNISSELIIIDGSSTIASNAFSCGMSIRNIAVPFITYNTFTGPGTAVGISDDANAAVHYNFFDPISTGVNNTGSQIVDATYNWWGDPTGPGPVGPGNGAQVSENVIYEPWLGADHCTNGIQDGDEEGIDCGGSCPPCIENLLLSCEPDHVRVHNPIHITGSILPPLRSMPVDLYWPEIDCDCDPVSI